MPYCLQVTAQPTLPTPQPAADHGGAAGGSSRRVPSITKTVRRGASKLGGPSMLRPGTDLVQDLLRATSNTPDAVLLLGGDLTVQVLQAQVGWGAWVVVGCCG